MSRTQILEILASHRDELRRFSVQALYLFGSHARDEAREDSDVDILVDFEPGARVGLLAFARLRRHLAQLLGREVDLVTRDALHRALRAEILREAVHAA